MTRSSDQADYTDLHKSLVRLKERGPRLTGGLCVNLDLISEDIDEEQLQTLFRQWPSFSGDDVYPVPSPEPDKLDHNDAFWEAHKLGLQWDPSTEYGRLRWQLLDWLIEKTKPTGVDSSRVEALNQLTADAQELKTGY